MFPRALRIATFGGVDVRVDPSLLIMAGLVLWTFLSRFRDGFGLATAAMMAIAAAVAFFFSVLIHELAHAYEARHRGIEVSGVTLFLLGGVTEMHLDTEKPSDEFAISAVGPYASLVVAALAGIVATTVDVFGAPVLRPLAHVAGLIGWINVALAVFNLIPGSPLDGGRVFRAIVWAVTKDRHRAVRIASRSGQVIAALLGLLALRLMLLGAGGFFDALWLILIAGFMWVSARNELRSDETEELLRGRTVGGLTIVRPPRLPADRPLSQVVDQLAGSPGFEVFPVVAEGDLAATHPTDATADLDPAGTHAGPPPTPHQVPIVGVLVLEDVMQVDRQDRGFRTAGELMRPLDDLPVVTEDEGLRELIRVMEHHPIVAVRDRHSGEVRSVLTIGQVAQALERIHALERGGKRHRPSPLSRSHSSDGGREASS